MSFENPERTLDHATNICDDVPPGFLSVLQCVQAGVQNSKRMYLELLSADPSEAQIAFAKADYMRIAKSYTYLVAAAIARIDGSDLAKEYIRENESM